MELNVFGAFLLLSGAHGTMMVTSGHGCSSFPPAVQFLCYQVRKIWNAKQISNDVVETVNGDMEHNPGYGVLGNSIQNDFKTVKKGCDIRYCVSCYNGFTCEKCQDGYFTQFQSDSERVICVKKCFADYVPIVDSHGIISCTEMLLNTCHITRCVACLDENTCVSCSSGYYPQFYSHWEKTICVKKCFVGYLLDVDANGNRVCKEIPTPEGCLDFSCSSCKRGYFLQINNTAKSPCSRKCPKGYFKDRIRRKCIPSR